MKRTISILLVMLMTLAMLTGCQEDTAERVYEKPTFTPGTMESDLLQAEPGNYQRCSDTSDGTFAEIETGYYTEKDGLIRYADKTNLEGWVMLCANPDCSHTDTRCTAKAGAFMYKDDRLWYCSMHGADPYNGHDNGMYLVSIAKNGGDKRWEYSFEEERTILLGGGAFSFSLYSNGYMVACDSLQADGNRLASIWLIDLETGPRKIFERVYDDGKYTYGQMTSFGRNRNKHALSGDLCIVSYAFTEDFMGDNSVLCWFKEGELVFSDISQFSIKGGYLSGGILRCLQPGDGYYDFNLETGEKIRLADAQLEDSGAMVLQPNCIIESTLLNPENTAQTQIMRFFDGETWHDVALPEGLMPTPEAKFHVVALTSDRVVFRVRSHIDDPERHARIYIEEFYQMVLDGDDYTLEFMCCMDDQIPGLVGW